MPPEYCDFCPLCGSTFYGNTSEEVADKIVKHIDSGYCQEHFLPLDTVLNIDCMEKARGKVW